MPELSRFYGLIVRMFYADHPPPHFHVQYGNHNATVGIETLTLLDGHLPRRASNLAIEWATIHQSELRTCWQFATNHAVLPGIEPLA